MTYDFGFERVGGGGEGCGEAFGGEGEEGHGENADFEVFKVEEDGEDCEDARLVCCGDISAENSETCRPVKGMRQWDSWKIRRFLPRLTLLRSYT